MVLFWKDLWSVGVQNGVYNVAEEAECAIPSRRVSEVKAVVDAYKKTPVKTVETHRVPFLPKLVSTHYLPNNTPGTPSTAINIIGMEERLR